MKKLAKILALLFAIVIIATGCKKLPEFTDGKTTTVSPTVAINVYTQRVTGIGDTKAYFEGLIDNTEISGLTVTVGFCWNTTGNPTLNDNHITTELYENFHFSCTVYGLVQNTTYYVKAWAIIGTENPDSAIYGNEESFTTQGSGGSEAPTGAINGLFSVSDTKQIYFSKGNLQYQASTNTWRFAENQWDCIGPYNQLLSPSYDGWIDLFGWGTSGYDHGAVCYQPWSTSQDDSDYYAYGNLTNSLYEQIGQADWGYNRITNGGNSENLWRTMKIEEWIYMVNTRTTNSGIRYAKAQIDNINGVIILPDNWNNSIYNLNNTNNENAEYSSNVISSSVWNAYFESNGAAFLPAAGYRKGTVISNTIGSYWSSSIIPMGNSIGVFEFQDSSFINFSLTQGTFRYFGSSVRLVHDAN